MRGDYQISINFVFELLALVVLSSLFVIVTVAIKIDLPGLVFFVQKRIVKGGKWFCCIKFRSMSLEVQHDVVWVMNTKLILSDAHVVVVGCEDLNPYGR